jgi:hypothetical protein
MGFGEREGRSSRIRGEAETLFFFFLRVISYRQFPSSHHIHPYQVLSLQHDGLAHIIAICQKDVQDLNAMLQASSTTVS